MHAEFERPIELIPTTYAYGGESISRLPDGRAVFIPFAIPGELLRVELVESKPGYARARLMEVLEPSSERTQPRCFHFGECGGCHYQHLTYPAQVEAKSAILLDQLARIGKLANAAIDDVYVSPAEFGYRNHVEFHLAPDGSLGYIQPHSGQVLAVRECHLPEALLGDLWPQLEFEPGSGVERIGLRMGFDDSLQIILKSDSPLTPEVLIDSLPVSVTHISPAGSLVLAGRNSIDIEVLSRLFRVSAGSFFQSNTPVAGDMVRYVTSSLEKRSLLQYKATMLELYCGVGLFSAFLASRVGRLVGVENSASAVDDFTANLDEFENVEIYEGSAEQVLSVLDLNPDFVLVDPPRVGLERGVLDSLLQITPPIIIYVSCDPATLSRDARRLTSGGYRLAELALFDQFPQTYHIESISIWER